MRNGYDIRKKLLLILFILLCVSQTACFHLGLIKKADPPPETVIIGQETYRTGFYGSLYAENISLSEVEYEVDGITFSRVDLDTHDWVWAPIGFTGEGTVYCPESQWESEKAYYENIANFTYYCQIDGKTIKTVPDMNTEHFEALARFCEENGYDPFDSKKDVILEVFPYAVGEQLPQFIFYKASNDGYFTSFRGSHLYVIEGKLYLLYYFEGEEIMKAVLIPSEIADYFLSVIAELV